ncbi:MAG: biopolymer transporter ExbD, partial [Verrucomicrobiae bacterium]|nr:biopolymer transporter ExbD [Verrucomicrobiae bacterium]
NPHGNMKRRRSSSGSTAGIDLSPMTDLSFLLLVYFLVTSTLDPAEADLRMTMPGPPDGRHPVVIDRMELEVTDAGHIVANGEVLDTDANSRDLPLLLDRLKTYASGARLTRNEPVVSLAAADGAKGQRFIDVLNVLAHSEVRIEDVSLTGFYRE